MTLPPMATRAARRIRAEGHRVRLRGPRLADGKPLGGARLRPHGAAAAATPRLRGAAGARGRTA
jgi:hypothetical protein